MKTRKELIEKAIQYLKDTDVLGWYRDNSGLLRADAERTADFCIANQQEIRYPEKKSPIKTEEDTLYFGGWNACIDEMKKLNGHENFDI